MRCLAARRREALAGQSRRAARRSRRAPAHSLRPLRPSPLSYNAIQHPASVHAEDYEALFAASVVTCAPAVAGAAPTLTANGTLSRNAVIVTIEFPDGGAAETDALAHFLPRVTAAGAFLTFDPVIHAENPSFAAGSECATQVPHDNAVYAVASATVGAGGGLLTLRLEPASVKDTHVFLDVSLKWDPDTGREVARRRLAGEPLGVDARRRLRGRELATIESATPQS